MRDAQGNPLAVYDSSGSTINWREQQLYGSSRLGMWKPNFNLATDSAGIKWNDAGLKFFELSNHLGNVMSVINDNRTLADGVYAPVVINAQDYYAFGSVMPGRKYALDNSIAYRYGFNGKENDNEVKGTGNQQDYGMRIYDPRVGKFLSVDPLARDFPWNTPYAFAENRPIDGIDFEGLEYTPYINKREYKSVNSAISIVENFNSFLSNVGANIYNGASGLINAATSTAVNTYKNGASNTAHNILGKAQQAYHSAKESAVAAKNYHVNTPAIKQLKDAGAALTDLSNYELPAEAILTGALSRVKVPVGRVESAVIIGEAKSFGDLMANPKSIWGKSADEVGETLGKGWTKSPLNDGEGWKFTQDGKDGFVSFSEGSTRHGNTPYYKINSGAGKTKVVGEGYKPTPNDKSTIIRGDQ